MRWALGWMAFAVACGGGDSIEEPVDSESESTETPAGDSDTHETDVSPTDTDAANDTDAAGNDSDDGRVDSGGPGEDTDVSFDTDLSSDTGHSGAGDSGAGDSDTDAGDSGLATDADDCWPPLTVHPEEAWVEPRGYVAFTATGGGVGYRWSMLTAPSGGRIAPGSGLYLAGSASGVDDRVALHAAGCPAPRSYPVHVVAPLTSPLAAVAVTPGTSVRLPVSGGSGAFACAWIESLSGGTLSPSSGESGCRYVAGSTASVDRVRVRDERTGKSLEWTIDVRPSNALGVRGERWMAPLGTVFTPEAKGGSGVLDVEVLSGPAERVARGALISFTPGPSTVRVFDPYVDGYTSTGTFDGLEPAYGEVYPFNAPHGYGEGINDIVSVDDIDGDGDEEFAVGLSRATTAGGRHAGAVGIWSGHDAEVAQYIEWPYRDDEFGRSLAAGDFDGDGVRELVVGAPGYAELRGRVLRFDPLEDALVDVADAEVFESPTPSGLWRFGQAVAACDFDADGFDDLAVGMPMFSLGASTSEGAVWIYRGSWRGLSVVPQRIVGDWVDRASGTATKVLTPRFGNTLAVGDFNADGRCDLVGGAPNARSSGSGSDGAVAIFLGQPADASDRVIASSPWRLWLSHDPTSDDSNWGIVLAAGDLDGDGAADLALGSKDDDRPASGAVDLYTSAGGVRLWLSSMDEDLSRSAPDPADLESSTHVVLYGDRYTGYNLGTRVRIADVDADDQADLLVGAYGDFSPYAANALTGSVRVYDGADLLAGAWRTTALPWNASSLFPRYRHFGPPQVNGFQGSGFGEVFAVVADAAEDGLPDLIVGAPGTDRRGSWIPDFWRVQAVVDSIAYPTRERLEVPMPPTGDLGIGGRYSADFIALDDSGAPGVVVGAGNFAHRTSGYRAGAVWRFALGEPSAPGGSLGSAVRLGGTPGYSADDRFGLAVASAGDFDGDGREDVWVHAPIDSVPSASDLAVSPYVGAACMTSLPLSNRGAHFVVSSGALQPSFAMWSDGSGGTPAALAGGDDVDGDGIDDVWVSTAFAQRAELYSGRAVTDPTKIQVLCPTFRVIHGTSGVNFGQTIASLGDLDGDGCAEVAVASPKEDRSGTLDRGAVTVLWGAGPSCARTQLRATTFTNDRAYSNFGSALAAADMDGDGKRDLLVGAEGYRDADGVVRGAVYRLDGAWIAGAGQPRDVVTTPAAFVHDPARVVIVDSLLRVESEVGTQFPAGMAWIRDPAGPGRLLALGRPQAASGAGRVEAYRWTAAGGLAADPALVIAAGRDEAWLGTWIAARGDDWLVTAPLADAEAPSGVDLGAVYVYRRR